MLDFKRKKLFFDIEPQEILLDKLAKEKEKKLGISEKKLEKPISFSLFVYFIFIFFVFLLFFWRLFWLQIVKGKDYFFLSENNRYLFYEIESARGIIYDKNFLQLTFNRKTFDLICEKDKLKENEKSNPKEIESLAQVLRKNVEELKREIEREPDKFFIINNLEQKKLILFQLNKEKIKSCSLKESFEREYREGEVLSPVLGYLGFPTKDELEKDKNL